ncbi:MAG: acetyl-CoA carboxylase biotin carboxyl carrier protein [Bryobacterales bacterium]|nr:acetyl-CoA carboxylase biotin carboxyl carrier protein [Bryobacterales bacterium]
MTIEEIKEIIQLLTESGVAEIEVQRGDNRVWIKRASLSQEVQLTPAPQLAPLASPVHPPASAPFPLAVSQPPASPPAADANMPIIKAPIVGTFYESPSPGSPPFVKVGDTVQTGQVLCIIESMKLMNEIEAEAPGVILSKLVPNGKPVEYGEALFTYRPL